MKKLPTPSKSVLIGILSLSSVIVQDGRAAHAPPATDKNDITANRMLRQKNNPVGNANPDNDGLPSPHAKTKAPALTADASGSTIYGWLGYTTNSKVSPGFVRINATDGSYSDAAFSSETTVTSMFIKGNRVCTYQVLDIMGMLIDNNFVEYDMESGRVTNTQKLSTDDASQSVLLSAYDPISDTIYGYSFTADSRFYQFFSAPASNPTEFSYITDATMCTALTWDHVNNRLVGVTKGSDKLVEIDPATAEITVLADCPVKSDYISGLCFSPVDNAYIWNPNASNASYLYKISLPDYKFTEIQEYPTCEQFMSLVCTDSHAVDPKAPATPSISNVILGQEEPQALIFYEIPATTFDGTPIDGRIDFEARVDDTHYHDGSVAAGDRNFMVNFIDISEGFHSFSLSLSLNGKKSLPATRTIYVGNDTPVAPENVVLTKSGISWDPVTKGVNNGVVVPEALSYTVSLDGIVIASGLTATHIDCSIPAGELAVHRASVVAVCNGHSSEPGVSNPLVAGNPLSLPVNITPTQEQFELCTVADSNEDNRTFMFTPDFNNEPSFCYIFSSLLAADDWVFLPPMDFNEGGAVYRVSLKAAASNESSPEAVEVYIGRQADPSSMTRCIIEKTTISSTQYVDLSSLVILQDPGTYVVGLHAVSDADSYYLYLRDVNVSKADIITEAPATVSDLQARPAPDGELKATVSFTFPTLCVDGSEIPEATTLTATAYSKAQSCSVEGTPGSSASIIIPTVQGDNTISIQVTSYKGTSDFATVNVYTGIALPGAVKNMLMSASEDNMTLHMEWDAPDAAEKDGFCPPQDINYYLCTYEQNKWIPGPMIGTDIYSQDITLPEGTPQQMFVYGIMAENIAGISGMVASAACVAGTPHAMPFTETFDNGACVFGPLSVLRPDNSYDMAWTISDPAYIDQSLAWTGGHALIGSSTGSAETKGVVSIAKVSTSGSKNAGVALTFHYGNHGDMEILVAGHDDMEPLSVGRLSEMNPDHAEEGYAEVMFPFPAAYQDRKWVQTYIRAYLDNAGQSVIIPAICVRELPEVDKVEGIDAGNTRTRTYAAGNTIHAIGYSDVEITVSSIDGIVTARTNATGHDTFVVPPGLYIVRCGTQTHKLRVGR